MVRAGYWDHYSFSTALQLAKDVRRCVEGVEGSEEERSDNGLCQRLSRRSYKVGE